MVYIAGHYIELQPFINYAISGAVLAIISQFGDLSASFIKRSLNIKDFGKILPGHGGIVDRMDSVLSVSYTHLSKRQNAILEKIFRESCKKVVLMILAVVLCMSITCIGICSRGAPESTD